MYKSGRDKISDKPATAVDTNDTIVALVTPSGGQPGAVEIIRLSGPLSVHISKVLFIPTKRSKKSKSDVSWNPVSHKVEYGILVDGSGSLVDEVSGGFHRSFFELNHDLIFIVYNRGKYPNCVYV